MEQSPVLAGGSPFPADGEGREELVRAGIAALDAAHREVLQVCALAWLPTTRAQILECLDHASATAADGMPWHAESLAPALEVLLAAGLLVLHGQRLACPPGVVEPAARSAVGPARCIRLIDAVRKVFRVADHRYGHFVRSFNEGIRDLRLCLYAGQYPDFQRQIQALQGYFSSEWKARHPYLALFDLPFDAAWHDSLPSDLAAQAAATVLAVRASRLEGAPGALAWLIQRGRGVPAEQLGWYATVIAEHLVLQGRLGEAEEWVMRQPSGALRGLVCLLRGRHAETLEAFDAAYAEMRKASPGRRNLPGGLAGVAGVVAMIGSGQPARLEQATQQIAQVMRGGSPWLPVYAALGYAARAALAVTETPEAPSAEAEPAERDPLASLFLALCAWWLDPERLEMHAERLQRLLERAEAGGYRWIAAECIDLLGRLGNPANAERAKSLHGELGTCPLAEAIRRQSTWERGLGALAKLASELAVPAPKPMGARLVWLVSHDAATHSCVLEPREQKRDAGGHWTRGRQLSLRRAVSGSDLEFLTEQDRSALGFIRQGRTRHASALQLDVPGALAALVGHPLLFWSQQPDRSLQLVRGEPELVVRMAGGDLCLKLVPPVTQTGSCMVLRDAPDRLRLIEVRSEHHRLARILGNDGLHLPASSQAKVAELLATLRARVPVMSEMVLEGERSRPAPRRLHALLTPHAQGLSLQLACYPLGDEELMYSPGAGPSGVRGREAGGEIMVLRDLGWEQAEAKRILELCSPWLQPGDGSDGGISRDPVAACEILECLHRQEEAVPLRWPAGSAITIAGERGLGALHARVRAGENWLSLDGNVALDNGQVLELQALLGAAFRGERFVALGEGRYLKLSDALRARAAELAALGDWGGQGLRMHPLVAPRLSDLLEDVGHLRSDRQWAQLLARQAQALTTEFAVPEELCAELRDYQLAGFRWLARLAELGAGACLADDMGLGKTLQVLTLLLHRRALGPALVVAPTSVAGNWVAEANRFAPSLRLTWIGPGQRDNAAPQWGPGDLVITSYTLFQQDAMGIASFPWRTAVLDEAQAIKNTGTKRSQAAMRIDAGFRLITTGTPIENNLSELWNLFRFINPGLLGSLESFQERFANPVERDGEAEARERLRRLIAPFVLRRTKGEVLRELPERTEVSVRLELGPEERSLYEAVRREALSEVEESGGGGEPNRMRVLAGIMRLRRTCCHPRLVAASTGIGSTKTQAFLELVRELREGGHRALVFSQFVDHLTVLREQLDARQIPYQYLDGGTPLAERVRRVAAFQAGQAELFLISLRAGGTGLNLTAADYVIHMDPWWNPAVEDQASDRAHRMGQTRPVTVYRLVMADSIEEKIMALHERKRHLADSLLDGVGEAASLSVQELLGLLREG